jgi:hypothetical protein
MIANRFFERLRPKTDSDHVPRCENTGMRLDVSFSSRPRPPATFGSQAVQCEHLLRTAASTKARKLAAFASCSGHILVHTRRKLLICDGCPTWIRTMKSWLLMFFVVSCLIYSVDVW